MAGTPRPQAEQAFDAVAWPAIRQSASRLSRNQGAFVQQLHYDVMSLMPDAGDASGPDMWAFCDRLVQSLLWVALTDQPLGVVAETLRRVGAQNWVEGFHDTQYGNVAHALVQTVHYLSESDWSASTGSAWIGFFMWIKPHLLAGAQQAAAQQAAAQRASAEHEAARAEALSRDSRGLLDDDDEDVGYGHLMVSMTRNPRKDPPRRTS